MLKAFPDAKILFATPYFVVLEDKFPVSPGHLLIVSKATRETYFDLKCQELEDLAYAIDLAKDYCKLHHSPDGYNIGMNCGEAAGQTVMQFHCHLIPRYKGDMEDPRGGVRHVIPEKGKYDG